MKTESVEERLSREFADLRRRDAGCVPAFDRCTGERRRGGVGACWWRGIAAAALVVLSVGAMMFCCHGQDSGIDMRGWAQVSEWKAPTDGLLTLQVSLPGASVVTQTDRWMDDVAVMRAGRTVEQ